MRGLKDRVAVVTGGLGDLGYATATRFVEEGCKVTILDLKANEQAQAIGAVYWQIDITQTQALHALSSCRVPRAARWQVNVTPRAQRRHATAL